MAVEIVMPRVDMDMSSGRMGRWHAAEGAHVVKGATLFEIETDKAAMEVDAPASGVLKFVAASEGDVLPVGACIGWIVADGETFAPPANAAAPTSLAPPPATGRSEESQPSDPKAIGKIWPDPPPSLPHDSPSKDGRPSGRPMGGGGSPGQRPRATPAARRVARERGLRLESVRGSGPLGRIQRRDIETPAPAAPAAANVHRLWLRRGEGAPIVFLHGFGADLNGWRPVHRLLPETRPALAIDLPGHGLSSLGEDASFEALVEAARAALAEEGVSAAHLVGHSLGGAVAAALSHERGVKALSLMLIAPAGLGPETNAAFFDGFLQADTEAGLAPWLHMLVVDRAALGSALARTTLRQRQERPLVAEQRRLAASILAGGRQTIDIRGHLAPPGSPTKIVFGLEDRITPAHHAEGLSGLIALHRFPRVGHMPHLEARR
ncbi:acetoin dehydrogenase dihydrolipoyllysine-residue acetyltransferase subunit, partial [Roseiarcus sp.]|uniref:acetoin dehydrogenase dihydrolipoyllysine-residue acetyltransferase subunit n=1 Tax=Roseiarcus sp. TaxID=1969460 RepID=UPI003D12AC16